MRVRVRVRVLALSTQEGVWSVDLDGQIAVSWAAGMQIRLVKREQPQPWALQLYSPTKRGPMGFAHTVSHSTVITFFPVCESVTAAHKLRAAG